MKLSKNILSAIAGLVFLGGLASCEEEQPFDITTKIGFASPSYAIEEGQSQGVLLYVNDQGPKAGSVSVEIIPLSAEYEYGVDFVTIPAAVNNVVTFDFSDETPNFQFVSLDDEVEEENSTVLFNILNEGTDFTLGQTGVISTQISIADNDESTVEVNRFYDFNDQTEQYGIPAEFTEVIIDGFKTDRGWGLRDYGVDGSWAVNASGYGGDEGTENAWLINDAMTLSGQSTAQISFEIFSNYSGPGRIKVLYSTDYTSGSPESATWVELTDYDAQAPEAGSRTWTPINLDVQGLNADKFVLAFQFIEATSSASSSWVIDNLSINLN
ncbi:choice-of-anchor J domain-containing protein [Mangrovivirga cuniculi]|uniref:DUF5017 domain-containing protein n=1 Tax=Mangrovivirga cuniculi TaxID=2715131 RepID=A0A4D7JV40_9BACT|nr:choice-of-anchor J domain-containing protein [Mangrovivirga cuniculi]QCK16046.1 hypothetical protein DCC35_15510 [Mangrovivirga cuniculi]